MEIRVLRYFLAVVDHGSATAAARAVRIAQPSLSRQLHGLEQSLGVELFRRGPGALRLSVAGERFLPLARDIVARADRARSMLSDLAQGTHIPLTVVAPPTTIADAIAPYIADRHPRLGLHDVIERDPRDVFGAVERGDADVGISTVPPPGSLDTRVVGRAPVRALVPPEHRFTGRADVDISELVGEPLILMRPNTTARLTFDAATATLGLTYADPYVASVTAMARAMAAAGHGVAVLTDVPMFGLTAIPIRIPEGILTITLYAGWDPEHFAAAAVTKLIDSFSAWHQGPG